jgi:uncharacterized protein HemX
MPLAFLAPIAEWLLGSKTGRMLLLVIAGAAAFGLYTWKIKHDAAAQATAAIIAKEQAATAAEHDRREHVLEAAQRQAAATVARLNQSEKHNADLAEKIRRLSAANDRKRCLDRDSARRLRELDSDRQTAGDGTVEPAR